MGRGLAAASAPYTWAIVNGDQNWPGRRTTENAMIRLTPMDRRRTKAATTGGESVSGRRGARSSVV